MNQKKSLQVSLFPPYVCKLDCNKEKFNLFLTFEGKKAGYGALTGEDSAMHFVKTYKVPLENVKYICAYTDGCMQYFENKEVSQKTIQNPDSIKDSGSERTLVIYSRD